jgi:hypothetical protein
MPIQMFDDGQKEFLNTVEKFGAQVSGLITERLHKKQFEDFLAGPSKDFKDTMQQATDNLMDETNPEGPAQGMSMLKSALETYMDEGARYADNPIIQGRVKQAFEMNMKMLDMEFKMQNNREGREEKDAAAAHESEKWGVEKANIQAQTAERLAKAGASGRANQDAAQGSSMFSGAPGSLTMGDEKGRTKELWSRIEGRVDRPENEAERKAVDTGMGEIRTQEAQKRLAEMVARGETQKGAVDPLTKKPTEEPWDIYNKEHLDAVAGTIDPADVRNRYIMKKANEEGPQQGLSSQAIDEAYGVLVDPTKANAFRPLKTPVSSENLGKIMFGMGGWDSLRDPTSKARPKNLDEATARLPETLDQARGPIADTYKKLATGAVMMGVKVEDIKTVEDMKKLMNQHAAKLAMAIIGDNADSSTLPEGMQQNRVEAGKLISAMTEMYAEEVFFQVTGRRKAAPAEAAAPGVIRKSKVPSGIDAALSVFGRSVGEGAEAAKGAGRGLLRKFNGE